jgi:hypothetical protein
MDGGPERIRDAAELATVRRQGLGVHARAVALVVLLAAFATLWP